ncbi:cupin domain-containing protein [Gillisia sp. CAL575]|uniref:cupin domain-containing protein n=1 Tax=Gillisia sp. CAL575 TaxID=985255 RepID=UPI0003A7E476|nr:cupin domain-containing protein [Gillisia sp. CAL575]
MYTIEKDIEQQAFNKLKVQKINTSENLDILSISLEKGAVFPEHTSPREAYLIMLEGKIKFHIKNEVYNISQHQHLNFEKEVPHWIEASENSKFLIVR